MRPLCNIACAASAERRLPELGIKYTYIFRLVVRSGVWFGIVASHGDSWADGWKAQEGLM